MQFNRSRFSIGCLLATVALIAVVIAGITFTPIILERARWQVHPSEQEIADYIRYNLSGTYRADPKVSFHIIDVNLEGTLATDKDVDVHLVICVGGVTSLALRKHTRKSKLSTQPCLSWRNKRCQGNKRGQDSFIETIEL